MNTGTALLLALLGLAAWLAATVSMLTPARLQAVLALFSLC